MIEMIVLLFMNSIIDKHIGDFTVIRNNSAVEDFKRNVNRGGSIGRNEPDRPVKINLSAGGDLDIRYHEESPTLRNKFIKRNGRSGKRSGGDGFGGIVISKGGMGGDKCFVIHTGDSNGDINASIRFDKAVEGTTGCAM